MLWTKDLGPIPNVEAREREMIRLSKLDGSDDLLLSSLQDPYGPIRLHVAQIIARRMTPALSDKLAHIVLHGDASLGLAGTVEERSAACLALTSESISDVAREALVVSADDESGEIRYHALLALHRGAREWDGFQPLVEKLLQSDSDPGVLVVCAQIVAEFGWVAAVPQVQEVYRRLRGTDRFQFALALVDLDVQDAALRSLIAQDLEKALSAEQTVAAAFEGLARGGFSESRDAIYSVMSKWRTHPINRVGAAAALHRLGDERGGDFLKKSLQSKRKDSRGYAIDLVGELRLTDLRADVEAIAKAHDPHASQALEAIAAFDDSDAFLKAIQDSHPNVEVRNQARLMRSRTDGDL